MGGSYIVKVKRSHKDWISRKSVIDGMPIYAIFETILFPYYQEHYSDNNISKISLADTETSQLPLSVGFGKTLRLEAIDKNTNVISLVNTVFMLYLENMS